MLDFVRAQDIFFGWVRQHYPNCLLVGPCTTGDQSLPSAGEKSLARGLGSVVPICTTQALMEGTTIRPDVFSYHYYNGIFAPRPNYFAVSLWNQLMGTTVYNCENPNTEGAHIYCHFRRDGKEGVVFLVLNNSLTEATTVHLPKQTQQEGKIELAPGSCTFFIL